MRGGILRNELVWVRFYSFWRYVILSSSEPLDFFGQVGEWLKPTDCKSVPPCEVRRFESFPVHHSRSRTADSAYSRNQAVVAQLVERVLGKDEVTSSILVNGSSSYWTPRYRA